MTTAANALKAYLEAEKTEYVDVPELGADGEPLRLFYTPFSGLDMATIQRKHDDFPSTKIEAMFDVIIQKAQDESGEKAFTVQHKPMLRRLPHELIYKMAVPMFSSTSVEEHEGN